MTIETCRCMARIALTVCGLFNYWPERDGWVFINSPRYSHVECPYCDLLLPGTQAVAEAIADAKRGFSQADGEAGG